MYAVMYTKLVTNNEATTIKTRQVNNNEKTFKKRRQAAERQRLCRARKRQQQNTMLVMCHTAIDEQLITPPHIDQRNGPTDGKPSTKRLQIDNCNIYTQGVTNNEARRQVNNNEKTLKKRQQAAERQRLCRARKRQQQNTTLVMCHTASDKQLITAPHIEQRNGPTDGETSAKRLQLDNCKNYTQGVTNNDAATINTRDRKSVV
jgi:hypothetical protein